MYFSLPRMCQTLHHFLLKCRRVKVKYKLDLKRWLQCIIRVTLTSRKHKLNVTEVSVINGVSSPTSALISSCACRSRDGVRTSYSPIEATREELRGETAFMKNKNSSVPVEPPVYRWFCDSTSQSHWSSRTQPCRRLRTQDSLNGATCLESTFLWIKNIVCILTWNLLKILMLMFHAMHKTPKSPPIEIYLT